MAQEPNDDVYGGQPLPLSDRLDAATAALDGVRHRLDAALAEDLMRAHEDGKMAARTGHARSACPYHTDELRRAWGEGYDRT